MRGNGQEELLGSSVASKHNVDLTFDGSFVKNQKCDSKGLGNNSSGKGITLHEGNLPDKKIFVFHAQPVKSTLVEGGPEHAVDGISLGWAKKKC
ncbi:hypothetical protein ACOSP7_023153 [Xanthoceras sorbifolium]